nr:hypothetical protein [Tanacetum cinerariifolium]
MEPLTFSDTHNMITLLTKSDASEGFDQIINFLNAHMIQYALMVNPGIYVLCIKQFWTFISIKKSNDVVRLQALIDRKKVIIIEDIFRQALRLDDAASGDCLSNEEIFAELERMGYEKPLLETCDTLTKQVANLEQDKIVQAIKITKLKQRVKRMHPNKGKIAKLDADGYVTLVGVEEDMNADVHSRLAESQAKVYHLDLQHAEKILSMLDTDKAKPVEVEEVPKAGAPRSRKGVVLQDPEETATASVIMHTEVKSKDKGKEEIEGEGSKRKGDSLNKDAAKKKRINEEEEELKAHL